MSDGKYTALYIGTDVGGTNTDSAIIANNEVICSRKEVTTADITTGVKRATAAALIEAAQLCPHGVIKRINIGTTHFVNAVIQRKGLTKVSVMRLCGPSTRAIPPFSDFPPDLAQMIRGSVHYMKGGCYIDGHDIVSLDPDEVKHVCGEIHSAGIRNVVIVGVFSSVTSQQETEVERLIHECHPDMSVTLSHHIGQLGMIQRENAAILNECLKSIAQNTVSGLRRALDDLGLHSPFFLTQNDGTIISAELAMRYPVRTFASGPTNSMRGAAFLTNVRDAVVVDIGGTSTDVGMLVNGFPRPSSKHAQVGGVVINYKMPDVFSVALGGGSLVKKHRSPDGQMRVDVGPVSVGYKIQTESLVFDGTTLTATDIAVARQLTDVGERIKVEHLSDHLTSAAMDTMHHILEDCIDRIKVSEEDVPVVLTGGGSVLVDKTRPLRGTSRIIQPPHFDVANAIGAGLCKVSGEVDYTTSLLNMVHVEKREAAEKQGSEALMKDLLDEARGEAVKESVERANREAVMAGADRDTLEILSKSDEPLSYMPGNMTRLRVKVVGDLAPQEDSKGVHLSDIYDRLVWFMNQAAPSDMNLVAEMRHSNQPHIDAVTGEWWLTEKDVESIALGAAVLGSGGGGNTSQNKLMVLQKLKEGKRIRIVTPQRFYKDHDLQNDLIMCFAAFGAPLAFYEKIDNGHEGRQGFETMINVYNTGRYDDNDGTFQNTDHRYNVKQGQCVTHIENFPSPSTNNTHCDALTLSAGRRVGAVMSVEVGGSNSMMPLVVAADVDLPVLDADCMGRAFPEYQMTIPFVYGVQPYPLVMTNEHDRCDVILWADGPKSVENHARDVCHTFGQSMHCVTRCLNGHEIFNYTVQHTLSRSWQIGEAIQSARAKHSRPVDAIIEIENGKVLINGKIVEVKRETSGGFNRGQIVIEGLTGQDEGRRVHVDFQNENLIAFDVTHGKQLLACVPDLITLIETDTGEAVQTEELAYGLRVSVLSLACSPLLTTPTALKVVGPSYFGYDVEYTPVGDYPANKPIPPVD